MANFTNENLVPSGISANATLFNFTECDVAADFLSSYYDDSFSRGASFDTTSKMLIDGLYQQWEVRDLEVVAGRTKIESMDSTDLRQSVLESYWRLNASNQELIDFHARDFAQENCEEKFCQTLGWQGNGDLAGRGMLFNYFAEAALVTLYMVAIATSRTKCFSGPSRSRNPVLHKLLVTFRETSRVILDATMIFSLAMTVTTIYLFVGNIVISRDWMPAYNIISSVFLSTWSLLPAIVLQNSTKSFLRRQGLRLWAWVIMFVLTFANLIFFTLAWYDKLPGPSDETWDSTAVLRQLDFMDWCIDLEGVRTFAMSTFALLGTIGAGLLIWGLTIRGLFRFPPLRHKRLKNASRYWRHFVSVLSLLTMWAGLGAFLYFRKTLSPASPSNMDHSWTLGQILALATFVPVLIEWGIVLLEGEDGLSGLVSVNYQVVQTDEARRDGDYRMQNAFPKKSRYTGLPSDEEGTVELSHVT